MRLYLVQHGAALAKEVAPDRPLSAAGVRDVRRVAAFVKGAGIPVARIAHSGKVRAEQTAHLLAPAFSPAPALQRRSDLNPKDPVEPLAKSIAGWTEDTLMVGHLPFLARLVSLLVSGDPELPVLAYQPASLVCLTHDSEGGWRIAWMIRPELLKADKA